MDPILIGFIFYLILILIIGLFASSRTKNFKDFSLGGNRLGPTVIAFSERASGESAWLLLGLPGAAMLLGLFEIWTVFGCLFGIILSWLLIAYPIRKSKEQYNFTTLPEYFEKRYNDKSGILRFLSAIIITFFFVFYISAQFSGAGKVLNVTFGITEFQGMLIGCIIIIFYTIMGGFLAVAWTDLVQGIIMISTLIILPLVGWFELNQVSKETILDWSTLYGGKMGFAALSAALSGLSWGLGYMGQPHLVARYMAIDKLGSISKSRKIAYAWAIPAFFGALFIGLIGAKLLEQGQLVYRGMIINSISNISDPEKLMPIMATNLLPIWMSGIVICGAIAAMMSTADSQLLVSTSIVTQDISIFLKKFPKKISMLSIGRIFTLFIGIVSFYLATQSKKMVFEMVSYAWGGLGASFGPALLLSLWWKETKKEGIIAGLLCGTIFTIYPVFNELITPRFSAFIISCTMIIFISNLMRYYRKTN